MKTYAVTPVMECLTSALENQKSFVKFPFIRHELSNEIVWVRFSKTLKVFALKGTTCVCCGAEGIFFEHSLAFGLVLFTIKSDKKVKMTRDHIIPQSVGGTDMFDNLQVMCEECNCKKGDSIPENAVHFINLSGFFNKWVQTLNSDNERQRTINIKRQILKDRWTSGRLKNPGTIAFHEISDFLQDYGLTPPTQLIDFFRLKI